MCSCVSACYVFACLYASWWVGVLGLDWLCILSFTGARGSLRGMRYRRQEGTKAGGQGQRVQGHPRLVRGFISFAAVYPSTTPHLSNTTQQHHASEDAEFEPFSQLLAQQRIRCLLTLNMDEHFQCVSLWPPAKAGVPSLYSVKSRPQRGQTWPQSGVVASGKLTETPSVMCHLEVHSLTQTHHRV